MYKYVYVSFMIYLCYNRTMEFAINLIDSLLFRWPVTTQKYDEY